MGVLFEKYTGYFKTEYKRMVDLYKSRLSAKLILSFVFIAVGFCIIVGVVVDRSSQVYNYDNFLTFFKEKCSSNSNDIDSRLLHYETYARFIVANRYIGNLLQPGYYSDSEAVEVITNYVVPFIDSVKELDNNLYKVRIFTNIDTVSESSGYFYNIDRVADAQWYKSFIKDPAGPYTILWQAGYPNIKYDIDPPGPSISDDYLLTLHAKIYDRQTERVYGILEIQYDLSKLIHNLAGYDQNTTGLVIINNKGRPLYEYNNDDEMEKAITLCEQAKSTADFIREMNAAPGMKGKYFIESRFIKRLDCTLLYIISLDSLYATQRWNRTVIIAMLVLSIIIIVFITSAIVSKSFKKLKKLDMYIKRVQKGELDVEVTIESQDEVGRLADNLNIMLKKIKELMDYNIKCATAEKEAQISALQAQLDPHFLYNSLEEVRMFAQTRGAEDISDMIGYLGQLMRYRASQKLEMHTTIIEEIKCIQGYIRMVNLLMDNCIESSVIIPVEERADITECRVMKMLLLTVVENAVKHGFGDRNRHYYIVIEMKKYNNDIEIVVRNNGRPISPGILTDLRSRLSQVRLDDESIVKGMGIGLTNIQQLMKLKYGSQYGLEINK